MQSTASQTCRDRLNRTPADFFRTNGSGCCGSQAGRHAVFSPTAESVIDLQMKTTRHRLGNAAKMLTLWWVERLLTLHSVSLLDTVSCFFVVVVFFPPPDHQLVHNGRFHSGRADLPFLAQRSCSRLAFLSFINGMFD